MSTNNELNYLETLVNEMREKEAQAKALQDEIDAVKSLIGNSNVGGVLTSSQAISENPYNLVWNNISNITYNGTIATLEFKISDSAEMGNYPIIVSYYKGRDGQYEDGADVNYDENFEPLDLVYVSGNITVLSGNPTVQPTIEPVAFPYEISSISLKTQSGETIDTAPLNESFIVDMEVMKKEIRNEKDYLFVAVYDTDGILLSLDYVQAVFAENYTYSFGFNIQPQTKPIGEIKAFVWNSFNLPEPLAESVKFIQ